MIKKVNESFFICFLHQRLDFSIAHPDAYEVVLVQLERHSLEMADLGVATVFAREGINLLQDVAKVSADLCQLLVR